MIKPRFSALPKLEAEFSEDQIQKAVRFFQTFQDRYLAELTVRCNPFLRPGISAAVLAVEMDFWKDKPRGDRLQRDLPKAKRLLSMLLAAEQIESIGGHRTLHAGSKTIECFAPKGFVKKVERFKASME